MFSSLVMSKYEMKFTINYVFHSQFLYSRSVIYFSFLIIDSVSDKFIMNRNIFKVRLDNSHDFHGQSRFVRLQYK